MIISRSVFAACTALCLSCSCSCRSSRPAPPSSLKSPSPPSFVPSSSSSPAHSPSSDPAASASAILAYSSAPLSTEAEVCCSPSELRRARRRSRAAVMASCCCCCSCSSPFSVSGSSPLLMELKCRDAWPRRDSGNMGPIIGGVSGSRTDEGIRSPGPEASWW